MLLQIKVHPSSRPQRLIKISEGNYEAHLKSAPEGNKANEELIKLFKKEFKATEVKIIRGKTSKKKVIEICP